MIYLFLLFIIFILLFIFLYKKMYIQNNYYIDSFENKRIVSNNITTWTPYVMDCYNQPCYSNYFYMNGYMYPVY